MGVCAYMSYMYYIKKSLSWLFIFVRGVLKNQHSLFPCSQIYQSFPLLVYGCFFRVCVTCLRRNCETGVSERKVKGDPEMIATGPLSLDWTTLRRREIDWAPDVLAHIERRSAHSGRICG